MTAASFMTFVSSNDVTVSALLVCSNKGTVSSLAEEYSGDELNFSCGLPLPLYEDISIDEQELLKPECNVKKIQLFFS